MRVLPGGLLSGRGPFRACAASVPFYPRIKRVRFIAMFPSRKDCFSAPQAVRCYCTSRHKQLVFRSNGH